MTTKTVWAAYFSATNTTKKVVTQIARRLSQQTACPMEIYDFTHPQAPKNAQSLCAGRSGGIRNASLCRPGSQPTHPLRGRRPGQRGSGGPRGLLRQPKLRRRPDGTAKHPGGRPGFIRWPAGHSPASTPSPSPRRPAGRTAAISPLPRDLPTKSSAKWRPLPPWKAFPRLP